MSKESLKPVWAIVDICGEKLQAVRPTRQLAREWNHEHNYGLGTIVKYIPAPVAPKAPKLKPLNGMSKDDARAWLDDLKAPKPAPKPVAVLTDWISCDTPPVRVGVYGRDHGDCDPRACFQYWDGSSWGLVEYSPQEAYESANEESRYQHGKWRGFTTPQE
jgi:hypothetical protein